MSGIVVEADASGEVRRLWLGPAPLWNQKAALLKLAAALLRQAERLDERAEVPRV